MARRQSIIELRISLEESATSSTLGDPETTSAALQQDNDDEGHDPVPDSLNDKVNKQLLKKLQR